MIVTRQGIIRVMDSLNQWYRTMVYALKRVQIMATKQSTVIIIKRFFKANFVNLIHETYHGFTRFSSFGVVQVAMVTYFRRNIPIKEVTNLRINNQTIKSRWKLHADEIAVLAQLYTTNFLLAQLYSRQKFGKQSFQILLQTQYTTMSAYSDRSQAINVRMFHSLNRNLLAAL